MIERERTVERLLRAAGVTTSLVGIGRDDDVVWAKFRVGTTCKTFAAASGESDEDAVADIVRQARQEGIDS